MICGLNFEAKATEDSTTNKTYIRLYPGYSIKRVPIISYTFRQQLFGLENKQCCHLSIRNGNTVSFQKRNSN